VIEAELSAENHSVRLIALRANIEETELRRRKLHAKATAQGRTASAKALMLCGWYILVTNIPKSMQKVEEIIKNGKRFQPQEQPAASERIGLSRDNCVGNRSENRDQFSEERGTKI